MTNISDLYTHVNELIKTDIDNMLVDMIEYGTPVSGETVTLNYNILDEFRDANGIGCFLCDINGTYNNTNDLASNVLYSSFIPADPQTQTYSESNEMYIFGYTDGFDSQFTFDDVQAGTYYVIICGYDSNNQPVFNDFTGEYNWINRIGTSSDGEFDEVYGNTPYSSAEDCAKITVSANSDNVWYVVSYV